MSSGGVGVAHVHGLTEVVTRWGDWLGFNIDVVVGAPWSAKKKKKKKIRGGVFLILGSRPHVEFA